jgi:hypothetical protein
LKNLQYKHSTPQLSLYFMLPDFSVISLFFFFFFPTIKLYSVRSRGYIVLSFGTYSPLHYKYQIILTFGSLNAKTHNWAQCPFDALIIFTFWNSEQNSQPCLPAADIQCYQNSIWDDLEQLSRPTYLHSNNHKLPKTLSRQHK